MPLYDYRCEKCSYCFEEINPISECDDDEVCPECLGVAKRVFVGTKIFILKGWCWSNDGYRSSKAPETKAVFNKDGTLKSQDGDKRDWEGEKQIFVMDGKKKGSKPKAGRKRVELTK